MYLPYTYFNINNQKLNRYLNPWSGAPLIIPFTMAIESTSILYTCRQAGALKIIYLRKIEIEYRFRNKPRLSIKIVCSFFVKEIQVTR